MKFNDLGFGAPIIKAFFLGKKGPEDISVRITKFVYTYAEEGEDLCEITISTDIVTLPDEPAYQEAAKWQISWGYLGGEMGPQRKVEVIDIKAKYVVEGLTLDLKLASAAYIIKQKSSQNSNSNITTTTDPLETWDNFEGPEGEVIDKEKPFYNPTPPEKSTDYVVGVSAWAGGSYNFMHDDSKVKAIKMKEVDVSVDLNKVKTTPGNDTNYNTLRKALDKTPGGPHLINSRDNKITIAPRNLGAKPFGTYYYRHNHGTLLEFTPETKNERYGSQATNPSTTIWDSLGKTSEDIVVPDALDGQPRLGDVFYTPVPGYKPPGWDRDYPGASMDRKSARVGFYLGAGLNRKVSSVITRSPTWVNVSTQKVVSDEAAGDRDGVISSIINDRRNTALERNPATAKVVGNPKITSEMVLTFLGLAKKFSGNYYVDKAVHTIDTVSGYITDLSLKRNSQGLTKDTPPWLIDGKEFGVEKNKQVGDLKL